MHQCFLAHVLLFDVFLALSTKKQPHFLCTSSMFVFKLTAGSLSTNNRIFMHIVHVFKWTAGSLSTKKNNRICYAHQRFFN